MQNTHALNIDHRYSLFKRSGSIQFTFEGWVRVKRFLFVGMNLRIDFNHLESVLCFMYNGEVRIKPHELDQFLSVAQELKVNGLVQDRSSQSSNEVNKLEPMPLKRSLPTTNDTPVHEVKRESSPPLHLRNKRILLQNIVSAPNTDVDEDSMIEDPLGSNSMMGEPSNSENPGSNNDQVTYDSSFQSESNESLTLETSGIKRSTSALTYELLDAELLKYVSARNSDNLFCCLKCSYKSDRRRTVKRHVEALHFITDGFSCDRCSGLFKTRQSLSRHILKVHKNDPIYFSTAT
ncbi:ZBTB10 [Lepeophtheirus salmonis]|uniref:ZBTB10 n=1 Tax=Lepeophtheirus salmonis TaxID=72036 RepID=A0A7R8H4G9_LEPSM|nr:ZBTB10 [Lepeophtheirus salmonis]CAF2849154.1 ZBTB10 [Lepeophtheirus salmonis]